MIHIRRDGGYLCGREQTKSTEHIRFKEAHKIDFIKENNGIEIRRDGIWRREKIYCESCVRRYYELIEDRLIIVE